MKDNFFADESDESYVEWVLNKYPMQDEYIIDELDNPENLIEWQKLTNDIYFN